MLRSMHSPLSGLVWSPTPLVSSSVFRHRLVTSSCLSRSRLHGQRSRSTVFSPPSRFSATRSTVSRSRPGPTVTVIVRVLEDPGFESFDLAPCIRFFLVSQPYALDILLMLGFLFFSALVFTLRGFSRKKVVWRDNPSAWPSSLEEGGSNPSTIILP